MLAYHRDNIFFGACGGISAVYEDCLKVEIILIDSLDT
jgi:hypothetical protein